MYLFYQDNVLLLNNKIPVVFGSWNNNTPKLWFTRQKGVRKGFRLYCAHSPNLTRPSGVNGRVQSACFRRKVNHRRRPRLSHAPLVRRRVRGNALHPVGTDLQNDRILAVNTGNHGFKTRHYRGLDTEGGHAAQFLFDKPGHPIKGGRLDDVRNAQGHPSLLGENGGELREEERVPAGVEEVGVRGQLGFHVAFQDSSPRFSDGPVTSARQTRQKSAKRSNNDRRHVRVSAGGGGSIA